MYQNYIEEPSQNGSEEERQLKTPGDITIKPLNAQILLEELSQRKLEAYIVIQCCDETVQTRKCPQSTLTPTWSDVFKFKKTEYHNFEVIVKLYTGGGGLRQPNPNICIGSQTFYLTSLYQGGSVRQEINIGQEEQQTAVIVFDFEFEPENEIQFTPPVQVEQRRQEIYNQVQTYSRQQDQTHKQENDNNNFDQSQNMEIQQVNYQGANFDQFQEAENELSEIQKDMLRRQGLGFDRKLREQGKISVIGEEKLNLKQKANLENLEGYGLKQLADGLGIQQGHPIQLISYNEQTKQLEFNQGAAEVIYQCDGDIGLASIFGQQGTGKSFLLNKLIGLQEDQKLKGFQVDQQGNPCTKGIWIWSEPIVNQIYNGYIFLLDSQGITNQQTPVEKLLAQITLLISSFALWNFSGDINEEIINSLANLIHIDNLSNHPNELYKNFPNLLWVQRDALLDEKDANGQTLSAQKYLEKSLYLKV